MSAPGALLNGLHDSSLLRTVPKLCHLGLVGVWRGVVFIVDDNENMLRDVKGRHKAHSHSTPGLRFKQVFESTSIKQE